MCEKVCACVFASVCEVVLVYVTLSVRSFVFTHVDQCISLLATAL